MTASLYDPGRAAFLNGDIDWTNDDIEITLVDTSAYTVNLSTHDFIADVPAGARIATETLADKTSTAGVAGCGVVTFSSVSGASAEATIIWQNTGNEATSRLIHYSDEHVGLAVSPNGNNITFTPDSGANKLFKL